MLPITIPIYHHTKDTESLKSLGIGYSIQDCEKRNITFYNINAVATYIDDEGIEYANIHTDGSQYISPMTAKKVNELIQAK